MSQRTRRQFLGSAGSAAAAAVLAPQALAAGLSTGRSAAAFGGGRFAQGVMSGDPAPRAITLWTALDDVTGAGSVELEVATDSAFRRVVARETLRTSAALGHTVKARVTGLKPYEQYHYRFSTRTKDSPVGRFRTALPADSRQPVSFAFYSCQDFTNGQYNGHRAMVEEDYDFVVCLGDYIYDETYHSVKDDGAVRDDDIGTTKYAYGSVIRAAVTLEDFRAKYALYRSDPALRAMQAKFPVVMLWDDHEVQDNYAGAERDGGLPAAQGFSQARRRAGYKAFFEHQPTFPIGSSRIYRTLRFGKTVELFVMDQRQYRQDQPCGDAAVPPCDDLDQPRAFLGRTQMNWLKKGLKDSDATWKVLANEVTMMPLKLSPDSFFTYDNWQGYPRERTELLTHIRDEKIKDVVVVTGDIHTFIAGDLKTGLDDKGDSVAVEFVGGSITSEGIAEIAGAAAPALAAGLPAANPWVQAADLSHHGFGSVEASSGGFDCELVRVDTIRKPSKKRLPSDDFRWKLERGQTSIRSGTQVLAPL